MRKIMRQVAMGVTATATACVGLSGVASAATYNVSTMGPNSPIRASYSGWGSVSAHTMGPNSPVQVGSWNGHGQYSSSHSSYSDKKHDTKHYGSNQGHQVYTSSWQSYNVDWTKKWCTDWMSQHGEWHEDMGMSWNGWKGNYDWCAHYLGYKTTSYKKHDDKKPVVHASYQKDDTCKTDEKMHTMSDNSWKKADVHTSHYTMTDKKDDKSYNHDKSSNYNRSDDNDKTHSYKQDNKDWNDKETDHSDRGYTHTQNSQNRQSSEVVNDVSVHTDNSQSATSGSVYVHGNTHVGNVSSGDAENTNSTNTDVEIDNSNMRRGSHVNNSLENNVNVTSSNSQRATSGSVHVSGNTHVGNVSSGNAMNSNHTSTTVSINN